VEGRKREDEGKKRRKEDGEEGFLASLPTFRRLPRVPLRTLRRRSVVGDLASALPPLPVLFPVRSSAFPSRVDPVRVLSGFLRPLLRRRYA